MPEPFAIPAAALAAARARRALLDVRDPDAFARGHLPGSGHLTPDEFAPRRTELPARGTPLLVLHDQPEYARAAARALAEAGYDDVAWLDAALANVPDGHSSLSPAERLWRPAPFLEEMLPRLPRGRALDVAAGHGRDSVYLAIAGYEVEAWDHAPEALAAAEALAARNAVRITTVISDLERAETRLPERAFDLVVCFRYLHRPLLPQLEHALRPGGALLYETFRLGQERYGRPLQSRFLLQQNELPSAFPGLEVEHYAELEPAGGPVTARLLARKPARAR